MRVTVVWSNRRVEQLDVHKDFAELLGKIGNPVTIQTYMNDVWNINIPTNVQLPADLQMVLENFFRCSKPRKTWPHKSHEKSVDEIIVIHKWFAWQRILVALNEIASTVEHWNRALTAAARIPETNFVTEKRARNAAGGPQRRKIAARREINRRIQPALDDGERDPRKLKKFYDDSFANENNKPHTRKTVYHHLKAILKDL